MNSAITIIDVRTPGEFAGGHVADSINIPVQEIQERMEEIRSLSNRIILCCASGARSEMAARFLNSQGIACENGGG